MPGGRYGPAQLSTAPRRPPALLPTTHPIVGAVLLCQAQEGVEGGAGACGERPGVGGHGATVPAWYLPQVGGAATPLVRDLSWSERCSVLVLVTSSTLLALYTCRRGRDSLEREWDGDRDWMEWGRDSNRTGVEYGWGLGWIHDGCGMGMRLGKEWDGMSWDGDENGGGWRWESD